MDYFGINTPEDLPKIREVLADQLVQPTVVNHTDFEQSEVLAVTDTGELISAGESTEIEEPYVNGHTVDAMTVEANDEATTADEDRPLDATPAETLEDEIVEEEFISDEIFAAEDEVIEELQIEEELASEDLPEDNAAGENDNENNDPTDEEDKTKE